MCCWLWDGSVSEVWILAVVKISIGLWAFYLLSDHLMLILTCGYKIKVYYVLEKGYH